METCGWPSVVYLPDKYDEGFCTGTLIHPEIVLFAAHCMDPNEGALPPVKAVFGESAESPAFSVPITSCFANPKYETMPVVGVGHDIAFCKLQKPVTDVPIVPVLAGCEVASLTPGASLTTVGFGDADNNGNGYGIKREVITPLGKIMGNEAQFEGNGKGTCYGDSGGPWFLKLPNGEWRVSCVTSWGPGDCGQEEYCALVHPDLAWLEATSGVDLTPCFTGDTWAPTAACGHFPSSPALSAGAWPSSCGDGALTGMSSSCGPAATDPGTDGGTGAGGSDGASGHSGEAGASGGAGAGSGGKAGGAAAGAAGTKVGPAGSAGSGLDGGAIVPLDEPAGDQGGCGCRTAESRQTHFTTALWLLAIALLARRRS